MIARCTGASVSKMRSGNASEKLRGTISASTRWQKVMVPRPITNAMACTAPSGGLPMCLMIGATRSATAGSAI